MRTGRKKSFFSKGVAGVLIVSLLFSMLESHVYAWSGSGSQNYVPKDSTLFIGRANSAVIKTDNSLWMWGSNSSTQLVNDATIKENLEPLKIMDGIKSVSMIPDYREDDAEIAVIKTDGSLWVWGRGSEGVPVHVMDDVRDIFLEEYSCHVIKTDGSLWELTISSGTPKNGDGAPVKILENVKSVCIYKGSYAAIKEDGSLWTWGENYHGELGNGTKDNSDTPTKILENVKAFSFGSYGGGNGTEDYGTCSAAIQTDGSLLVWGKGKYTLGLGTRYDDVLEPVKILDDVEMVSHGNGHCAAIKRDGSLWMWGYNNWGELGNETKTTASKPIKIMDDVEFVNLHDFNYSMVIKKDRSLWMWGNNNSGQLGYKSNQTSNLTQYSNQPTKVLDDVQSASMGINNTVAAIKTDGSLWMWGNNDYGQLGNGTKVNSFVPVEIMSPGSISGSGSTNPSDPDDPDDPDSSEKIYIGENDGPVIKVVDINGRPIADATVIYRTMFSYITSDKGMVTLDNYQSGSEVLIMKSGYKTKIIPDFVNNKEGITTYILTNDPPLASFSDVLDSVLFIRDRERIDLLTEEACINTYYKDEKFDIICTSKDNKYDNYEIYSGEKKIKENTRGEFKNLSPKDFNLDQPVYLSIQKDGENPIKKELNLHVIYFSPPIKEVSFIEDQDRDIGEDIIFLKGQKITINMDKLPIEWYTDSDGTVKAGINMGALSESMVKSKKLSDKIDFIKGSTKDNISNYFRKNSTIDKYVTDIKPEFQVVGYLESNANINEPLSFKGTLFVAFSIEFSHEFGGLVAGVPTVVEISLTGKASADGSIELSSEEEFKSEKELGISGSVSGKIYAGPGVKDVISAGAYGALTFYLHYIVLPKDHRGVDEMYFEGEVGVRAEVLGRSVEYAILDDKLYIVKKDSNGKSFGQMKVFSLNNYDAYESIDRSYLQADGTMENWMEDNKVYENGNARETVLQNAAYFSTVPHIVRMGDTVMLFYLTDAGAKRDEADRSILVYSLWDKENENWSEPIPVLENETADFNPDFYSDGNKIYAVWQDAEESLKDLSLEETAKRLTLHAAVYDEVQNQFVDLGKIESENDLFQQRPQIMADDNGVSVYWYENAQDNVLGLSGTNRIYRANLTDQNVLAEGIQVMSVPEEETRLPEESDEEIQEEESISENTAVFREFVALTEEIPAQETLEEEGSVSENTIPEDDEENDTPTVDQGEEGEEENPETVSDNTLPEESVSENTISENSIQANTYNAVKQADQPWAVTFLQEEKDCILSADAGRMNGNTGYAFVAGTMDQSYDVKESKVVFIEQGQNQISVLGNGTAEKVEFVPVYAGETLTWFEAGDIHYIDGNGNTSALFGESRIPSWSYTLLSDGSNPEVVFPVNIGGKSNLYRIGRENGVFLPSLQVTEQEDYIQYADGFIRGGETILVYNKMKVNDKLEEVNNSLCTGTIAHNYYDIAMQSAGSMVLYNEESGEYELEIAARLYNNGTVKAENLNLSLCGSDGSVLESVPIDIVLDPGETDDALAVFSLDHITQEAEYTITLSGTEEANKENNSVKMTLGGASLRVEAKAISVADTRIVQAGIQNAGVTACGGTVSVRNSETGKEYASGSFEPIEKGKTVIVEVELEPSVFEEKEELALEVVVIPDQEKADAVRDLVKVYIPSYEVNFVTDTETSTVYIDYGKTAEFPANPVKDGAHFAGWYDTLSQAGGTLYTEETAIKSDVTLYARFVQEQVSIPLENCSVSEIPTQMYTGKALKPAVTVKWGSEVLNSKKDYTVSYQNNKEQGTATVTISGRGKYAGSITRSFLIKYDMNKVSVSKIPAVNFTGENHTPEVTVTYNKKTLVKNTDYTVTYTNNRNAGTAGITLTGKGKYTGMKTVTFRIQGTAITGMVFDKIPDVPYNGSTTRPIVTVKTKDGTQLQAGSDYRLIYENTVNKGTATVTVVGNGNYTGTKKLTYKVVAKPLTEAMISGIEDAVYTGSPVKPAVTVRDGAAELAAGKDYTISYSKNKAVGTATVTVKGKGNYSGTVKLPFAITPMDLAQAQSAGKITVRINDIAYTGMALKPAVQIYEKVDGKEKKIPAGGYTLSYTDNTEMGTGTVTITGKGSYTGTVTAQFRIVEKAKLITSLKVGKIADAVYTGTAVEPDVTVTDGTYTLVKGKDYELSYKNQYNAGKATVTIKGIGSYAGSKDVAYKIGRRAVGNKTVLGEGFEIGKIPDEKYTGYALKPDVVVKGQGKTLVLGTDYKLSYKSNTKIGSASVTVTGIGNYSGSYNALRFNIVSWDYNDLQAQIENQVYTGKTLKPQVTFYTGGEAVALKPGTAVKVVYKDNKGAGTAAVTITGKGELKNMTSITASFEIEPADIAEAVVGRIPNQTLKGVAVTPVPKVKVGKSSLKAGRDFTVSYLRNGVKGEAQVIITGTGNYIGECRKSFIVQ